MEQENKIRRSRCAMCQSLVDRTYYVVDKLVCESCGNK